MTTETANADDHAPTHLHKLTKWVSPQTLQWLQEAEERAKQQQADTDDDDINYTASLFQSDADKEEELELLRHRIRYWKTSVDNPDGIFDWSHDEHSDENDGVNVIYIMSDSSEGHGDLLWPSSRHISNLLGNRESCLQILSPLHKDIIVSKQHPLLGLSFLELGSGAGVPSWTAMRCGARVVCTDQHVPERIRCIAECAERNYRDMQRMGCDEVVLENASKACACPYNWGKSIDDVVKTLRDNEKFDVVVAADCCYMPHLQRKLLQSIDMLMSQQGVALVPFALHGNASDEDVWGVVDKAKDLGFVVDILEPKQLTPSVVGMDMKRGLVQTLRLTR